MASVGKAAVKGGGVHPGVSLVLQDSDTGSPGVWLGVPFTFGRDDEYGVYPHDLA